MALTLSAISACVVGDRVEVSAAYVGDASYATGGYAFTPSTFGLDAIDHVLPTIVPVAAAGVVAFNETTNKLQLFTTLTGTEVVNTTNVSTVKGRLIVRGKGRTSLATQNF